MWPRKINYMKKHTNRHTPTTTTKAAAAAATTNLSKLSFVEIILSSFRCLSMRFFKRSNHTLARAHTHSTWNWNALVNLKQINAEEDEDGEKRNKLFSCDTNFTSAIKMFNAILEIGFNWDCNGMDVDDVCVSASDRKVCFPSHHSEFHIWLWIAIGIWLVQFHFFQLFQKFVENI